MRPSTLVYAFVVSLAGTARADTIVLANGQTIEADQAWFEGAEVRYRKAGTLYVVPRQLVQRVDAAGGEPMPLDPDVRRSRDRLSAGDPGEALRYARLALFRDPASVPALEALAAAQLALGHPDRARDSAERAIAVDPARAQPRELLGDAFAALEEPAAAREQYLRALSLGGDERLRHKLDLLGEGPAAISSARYRIRYDGAADEPLGIAVLRALDAAWDELEARLGFAAGLPVTVVLQTETSFRDTTRAPEWAAAWNDGTIRVPVKGLERPTPGLVRVLRHELAHSFVASRAGANCPTWLHEGIAQWLEGGEPGREDAMLAPLARAGSLTDLVLLEGPFLELPEARAALAYAHSLSAVAYIVQREGQGGLRRLIDVLGEGRPPAEALSLALGIGYPELQHGWREHLRTADRSAAPAFAGR